MPHSGFVDLKNSFDEVWQHLSETSDVHLRTATKDKAFVTRATTATRKGSSESEKVIIFLSKNEKGESRESADVTNVAGGIITIAAKQEYECTVKL